MAVTTPVNSGYTIINGSTQGSNGSKVNTWLEYKSTQNISANTSTIDVYFYSQATQNLSTEHDVTREFGYVAVDGTKRYKSLDGYSFKNKQRIEWSHSSFTVTHDADGKKTVTISGAWSDNNWSSYITSGSASASVTLPQIPRYATVSQSLGGKTETGITVKWSSDSTIDYVWYSKDNGSNWTAVGSVNATSGSYTISGLSANTSYTIKTRVRRKDSQLTTDSSAMAQTTYNYPYATSMPNFTIDNTLTIGLYNPLGRTVTVSIIGADNSECSRDNTSGTSITGYTYSSIVNALYNSIPNAKSGTYKVKVTYGSSVITKTGGTYSANASACTPTIGGLTYQDTKTATVNITGNNQQIIRNQSTVRYTASSLSAKNGATISSVKVVVNGSTYNLTVSGTSATGGNAVINSGTNVTATATITDSRGYTATKTVTVQMLDWVLPTALITLQRQNNYYTPTSLKANCTYSSLGGKNTITITYKAKKQSSSSWELTGSLTNNTAITIQCDNQYDWDVQVVITDKLGTTTYNTTLSRGTPIIFFDRQRGSTGFNGFPAIDNGVDFRGDVLPAINGKPFVAEAKGFALYGGTDIPNNSDLNDDTFMDAGTWYCQTNAIANTLTNCPTGYAFRMVVAKTLRSMEKVGSGNNWNGSQQIIYDYMGNVYSRYIYYADTDTDKRIGVWYGGLKDNTEVGNLGWNGYRANGVNIPTLNTLAYWNGAYSGTASNLEHFGSNALNNLTNHGTFSGSNANDCLTLGLWLINPSTTTANIPYSDWGFLRVEKQGNNYIQTFFRLYGQNTFVRVYANGDWRGWRELGNGVDGGTYNWVTATGSNVTLTGSTANDLCTLTVPHRDVWLVEGYCKVTATASANTKVELYLNNYWSNHRVGAWIPYTNTPLYMQYNHVAWGTDISSAIHLALWHSADVSVSDILLRFYKIQSTALT